ncbi:hypothetical protein EOPP23_10025 [Endozoicomonas sp. OPT23]|uniref:hypothetical protein n=1 Tax=Endozoicomonas sp. OPT23 TaxID=2072845 RepID=UPI00129A7FAB|nr:hypothetical protein [Endozoicomonas sp. OPT23]MRI33320.1 hypothetical protein [Endozoicomonas sp. OPT23]
MPLKADSGKGSRPPLSLPENNHEAKTTEGVSTSGVKISAHETHPNKYLKNHQGELDKSIAERSTTPALPKKSLKFDIDKVVFQQFQSLVNEQPSKASLKQFNFTAHGFRAHIHDDQAKIAKEIVRQGLATYVESEDKEYFEVQYAFPKDFHQRLAAAETALSAGTQVDDKSLTERSVKANRHERATSVIRPAVSKPNQAVKKRALKQLRPQLPFLTRWAIRLHLKPSKAELQEIANRFPIPFNSLTFASPFQRQINRQLEVSELKFCRVLEQVGLVTMKKSSSGKYKVTVQRPYDLSRQLEAAERLANCLPEAVMAVEKFNWTEALNNMSNEAAAHLLNNSLLLQNKQSYRLSVISQQTLEKLKSLPVSPIKSDH